jgi:hypothetical protein
MYRAAAGAIREGRFAEAAALARRAVDEAEEGHRLYPVFADRAFAFMVERGVAEDAMEAERARLLSLLDMPDGSRFDPEAGWRTFVDAIDVTVRACDAHRADDALEALERARRTWRATHDRGCDLVFGAVDACARLLGEDTVADAWDALMAELYPTRDRYDVDARPWSQSLHELLVDAFESLRGHLSGPERMGDVEVVEEEDRFVLRFEPCGSGGRTYQPDAEGGPPRMEEPFAFGVTTEAHDWSWGSAGVCLYCVHCCRLQEQIPIERLGYPVRVVDPPIWPAARAGGSAGRCTWTIYKDPALIPEEAYRRVGATKPGRLGSRAVRSGRARPEPQ